MSKIDDIYDDICMAFLKLQPDLALKEGEENRVHNAVALDKTDVIISAIGFTIRYMQNKK